MPDQEWPGRSVQQVQLRHSPLSPIIRVELPEGSQIMNVGCLKGTPRLWVEYPPEFIGTGDFVFLVVRDGEKLPLEAVAYVGMFAKGSAIYHLYTTEVEEPEA